jgi:hypothetical protein
MLPVTRLAIPLDAEQHTFGVATLAVEIAMLQVRERQHPLRGGRAGIHSR